MWTPSSDTEGKQHSGGDDRTNCGQLSEALTSHAAFRLNTERDCDLVRVEFLD